MKFNKFLNNIIIIGISLLSIYIAFFGNIERDVYKLLIVFSIIPVMLIPYILNIIFKLKIDEPIITLYLIFIFLAHFLGTIANFYYTIPSYDKLMHTFSGIMTSFLALIVLVKFKKHNNPIWFNILFIISFSALVALGWEIFEFVSDNIFGKDAQKVIGTGVTDTMIDMIVAFIGSIIFSFLYVLEEKVKRNGIVKRFIKQIE